MANKYLCVYQRNDQTNLYQEVIADNESQIRQHFDQSHDVEHVLFVVKATSAGAHVDVRSKQLLDLSRAICILRRDPDDGTLEA